MKKIIINALLSSLLLSGCALGPDYARPDLDLPAAPGEDEAEESFLYRGQWWEAFNDSSLNQLEEEAIRNNRNLALALARVEAASAAAGVAFADRLPQIGINFEGGRQQSTAGAALLQGPNASRMSSVWQAGGLLSFELDLWGKYRRLDEAARAELLASEAVHDSVLLTLTADMASAYFQLRVLQAEILITENMLATYEQTRQIFAARLRAGIIQEIDLRRIEAEIAVNSANLHLLRNGLTQAEGVLAVLLGRGPRLIMQTSFSLDVELTQITLPPDIPDQAPSDLLTRRPDIRAAEGQLIAANARIGAARAAFFPSIALTANGGYASGELDSLFISPANLWSFVGNLTQPLFQGGRLVAREAMAMAQYRQMLANYELTVQQAFREVRESLINNQQRREITRYSRQRVEALARSLTLANRQYEQGAISLMDLLDVRRNLLRSQLDLAESQANQLNAVVLLCKSLGGGWRQDSGFAGNQPPQAEREAVE